LKLTTDRHEASRGLSARATCCDCNIPGKQAQLSYEAFTIDGQWLYDRAFDFARWQHPAVGHGARFAVPGSTFFKINLGFIVAVDQASML